MEEITEKGFDLAEALGASPSVSSQMLTLYIPNKDRHSEEFGTQRKWVLEAASLLARIGGGFTVMPAAEGGWLGDNGKIVWDNTVVVYTYVKPDEFLALIPSLREFLHRLGRETDQGEVAVAFDGEFFRITIYDSLEDSHHD